MSTLIIDSTDLIGETRDCQANRFNARADVRIWLLSSRFKGQEKLSYKFNFLASYIRVNKSAQKIGPMVHYFVACYIFNLRVR